MICLWCFTPALDESDRPHAHRPARPLDVVRLRAALHRFGFLRAHRVMLSSNSYMALEKAKGLIADASERTAAA